MHSDRLQMEYKIQVSGIGMRTVSFSGKRIISSGYDSIMIKARRNGIFMHYYFSLYQIIDLRGNKWFVRDAFTITLLFNF